MNNLLSYCGLVDAQIKASGKDLPVHMILDPDFPLYNKYKTSECRIKHLNMQNNEQVS